MTTHWGKWTGSRRFREHLKDAELCGIRHLEEQPSWSEHLMKRQEQSGVLEELEAVLGGLSRRYVVGVMEGHTGTQRP